MKFRFRRFVAIAALSTMLVATSACSANDSAQQISGAVGNSDIAVGDPNRAPEPALGGMEQTFSDGTAEQPIMDRQVIRTAFVGIRSDDVRDVTKRAADLAVQMGGFVSDSNFSTAYGGGVNGSLTARVPAANLSKYLEAVSTLGEVVEENVAAQDVTAEVIDIQARIDSSKKAVDRLRELLQQANSLDDVIMLENEISMRQAELDSYQGQFKYLADQTTLSTVTVSVSPEEAPAPPKEEPIGFAAAWANGMEAFSDLTARLATTLGFLGPTLLFLVFPIFAVFGLGLWLLVRIPGRRRSKQPQYREPVKGYTEDSVPPDFEELSSEPKGKV